MDHKLWSTSDLQESLILMKDRLCWSADDIKNLKLNARKVDEVDKMKYYDIMNIARQNSNLG